MGLKHHMKYKKRLKVALMVNASFSLICGVASLVKHASIAKLMCIKPSLILQYLGLGLLCFSVFVFFNAFKQKLSIIMVKSIIFQDWLWVIASLIIVGSGFMDLSDTGRRIILITAVIVALFATIQQLQLKNLTSPQQQQ